jgi:hypothetical protein
LNNGRGKKLSERMKRASLILLKLILLLTVITAGLNFPVQAQPASQWAADQKVPGYLDDTFTPYLLADQNRTVHAFASQWIDEGDRRLAIVYRKWTLAGGWTRPVDVLLALSGSATFLSAFLDSFGIVHVIFANGESRSASIYYANAPAELADSALAWSVPEKIGIGISGVNSAAMTGDDQGNLIVIYSGNIDGSGVYALNSSDSGQRWTDPLPVFLTPDEGLVPYSLRLFNGPEKQFRAGWNVVTSLGVDELLYFSSYDVTSAQWIKPVELDKRIDIPDYFGPSFPSMVDNGEEIVFFYNGGKPSTGRPVQRVAVSTNGGRTWSDPVVPFPDHVGRSGENALVLDGAGRPHALFVQRIESTTPDGEYAIIGGVWHSVLESGSWTSPDRFVTTYAPHDVRAVVVQGDILLVVWREDPGVGEHGIWYTYSHLDVPESPVTPLAPAILPTSESALTQPTIVVQTPTPLVLSDTQREILDGNTNPASPFIAGIIPVLIVLAGVIVTVLALRRRQ